MIPKLNPTGLNDSWFFPQRWEEALAKVVEQVKPVVEREYFQPVYGRDIIEHLISEDVYFLFSVGLCPFPPNPADHCEGFLSLVG